MRKLGYANDVVCLDHIRARLSAERANHTCCGREAEYDSKQGPVARDDFTKRAAMLENFK